MTITPAQLHEALLLVREMVWDAIENWKSQHLTRWFA